MLSHLHVRICVQHIPGNNTNIADAILSMRELCPNNDRAKEF